MSPGIDESYDLIEQHLAEIGTAQDRITALTSDIAQLRAHISQLSFDRASRTGAIGAEFSPAQARVLPYLKSEMSNQEIADVLHLSVETVKTHLHRIYARMGVSSRREAAAALAFGRKAGEVA